MAPASARARVRPSPPRGGRRTPPWSGGGGTTTPWMPARRGAERRSWRHAHSAHHPDRPPRPLSARAAPAAVTSPCRDGFVTKVTGCIRPARESSQSTMATMEPLTGGGARGNHTPYWRAVPGRDRLAPLLFTRTRRTHLVRPGRLGACLADPPRDRGGRVGACPAGGRDEEWWVWL